jgi:hypothetical protein
MRNSFGRPEVVLDEPQHHPSRSRYVFFQLATVRLATVGILPAFYSMYAPVTPVCSADKTLLKLVE